LADVSRDKPRIVFMYLGRRGALGRFTLELAEAAAAASATTGCEFEFVISSSNEIASQFERLGLNVTKIDTFERATPLSVTKQYFPARRALMERLARHRPAAVVTLMPHVWSPILARAIRQLGIKYLTIIHDAVPHPGDKTAWMTRWLRSDAKNADVVITLSRAVTESLVANRLADPARVLPLFHPDLTFASPMTPRRLLPGQPLRLLFFGRIMRYKGLSLLLDAAEILSRQGAPVRLGIAGSGDLEPDRARLEALGADILNRWISDDEVPGILVRYDAMACSHVEASQSGVASTAFGNAMPVVAMPVGGIAEQVVENKTGVLARRADPQAYAAAAQRLATEPGLYDAISSNLVATARDRSMARFLEEIVAEVEILGKNSR